MRKILIYIFLLVCSASIAQTAKKQVLTFENDVNVYVSAISKIVKQNDCDGGIADLTSLIDRCEKEKGYSLTMLSSFYKGRGHGFFKKNDYSKSVSDYKKAIALLLKAGEEGKSDLSDAWYQLSLSYYYWGKPSETMYAADECVKSAESYFGPYHSSTFDAYSLRSNYGGIYNKGQEAMQDRKKCFEIIQNNVERNFTYLTTAERTAYWEKYLPETTIMFAFAQKLNVWQSEFTDVLFNQQLLAKGLLLTAESALQRAIDSNPKLSSAYQRIRSLRKKASDVKTSPKDAEAAILEADRIERDLGTTANSLYQFMGFLKVHTDDVRSKLGIDDIAVEFVDYRFGKDSTMYAALVLSPKWEHVRFIPLIEKREIEKAKDSLAVFIWEPLLNSLGNPPKNIYFAPSGLLYQIPIESQKLSNGKYICDVYNLYRMSSMKWLCRDTTKTNTHEAVVYGGIHYDESADRTINPSITGIRRGVRESSVVLPYLPATLTEAQTINSIINQQWFKKSIVYTGKHATENSFKGLSGKHTQLIHIATHGFYDNRDNINGGVLSNCGLCFSGANAILNGIDVNHSEDDILTAEEISNIDLNGLELISLSACETGLGDISYDGVWGLQRGFKKAGANSILMSLWKVDDDATCLLMTEFYKNWIAWGKSKYDSFELAKQVVRSHKEKGWDDPKYWAAFILLDGYN